MNIKYLSLKDPKKINLECFNNTTFFSTLNNENKKKEFEKDKQEGEDKLDNLICALVFCRENVDITLEFRPYFSSKLEIKGEKNNHYIFYCSNKVNKEKIIDFSKLKIETKDYSINLLELENNKQKIIFNNGAQIITKIDPNKNWNITTHCGICGTQNLIIKISPDVKCQFCECPLLNIQPS